MSPSTDYNCFGNNEVLLHQDHKTPYDLQCDIEALWSSMFLALVTMGLWAADIFILVPQRSLLMTQADSGLF